MRRTCACFALVAALALSGCAEGIPLGRHLYLTVGVHAGRVDHAGDATGVSSRSWGFGLGCGGITLGQISYYCAHLPTNGDVGIIERGSGAGQHFKVLPAHKSELSR